MRKRVIYVSSLVVCMATLSMAPVCPVQAAAEAPRANHRFHLLTPALNQRLDSQTRRRIAAIGAFKSKRLLPWGPSHETTGTAFVIERSGDKALMLSNIHVVHEINAFYERSHALGAEVHFGSPRKPIRAKVERVVYARHALDFTLIDSKWPQGVPCVPIPLSATPPIEGLAVYSSGFTALDKLVNDAVALSPLNQGWAVPQGRGLRYIDLPEHSPSQTIQTGFVLDAAAQKLRTESGRLLVAHQHVALPAYRGASGSPLISTADQSAVGLLATASLAAPWADTLRRDGSTRRYRKWVSGFIPLDRIVKLLLAEVDAGGFDNELSDRLLSVLPR